MDWRWPVLCILALTWEFNFDLLNELFFLYLFLKG